MDKGEQMGYSLPIAHRPIFDVIIITPSFGQNSHQKKIWNFIRVSFMAIMSAI